MNKYEINISHRTFGSGFQEVEASSAPRAVQQAIDFMFPRNAVSPIPDLDQALAFGDVTIELKLVKVAAGFRGEASHDPAFSLISDGSDRSEGPLPNKTGRSGGCTCTIYPPSAGSPGGYRTQSDDCPEHRR